MKTITKISLILLSLTFLNSPAQAQRKRMQYRNRVADSVKIINTQEKAPKTKAPKLLSKENAIGFRLNTDGWSAYYNYGIIKKNEGDKTEIDKFYDVLLFQLEVGEKRHPKEKRAFDYYGTNNTPFFNSIIGTDYFRYGKINTFYQVKLGVGYKKLIAGKPDPNTISVHWTNIGGLSLGLLKPYYFISSKGDLKLSPELDSLNLVFPQTRFFGAYGYRRGWSELKIVPGLHYKSALTFDFNRKRKSLSGVEVGLDAEYYFTKIDQMAYQDAKSFFLNVYASFELGWKQ